MVLNSLHTFFKELNLNVIRATTIVIVTMAILAIIHVKQSMIDDKWNTVTKYTQFSKIVTKYVSILKCRS